MGKIQWRKESRLRGIGAVCHTPVVGEGLMEERTLEERLEGGEGISLVDIWGPGFQVEGKVRAGVLCPGLFKDKQEGQCAWSRLGEQGREYVKGTGLAGPCENFSISSE